ELGLRPAVGEHGQRPAGAQPQGPQLQQRHGQPAQQPRHVRDGQQPPRGRQRPAVRRLGAVPQGHHQPGHRLVARLAGRRRDHLLGLLL
ncbi:MAG: hypothetical protein AVDCRST_MAG70-1395, partial [uncultured Thermomicrobiales bacterium]